MKNEKKVALSYSTSQNFTFCYKIQDALGFFFFFVEVAVAPGIAGFFFVVVFLTVGFFALGFSSPSSKSTTPKLSSLVSAISTFFCLLVFSFFFVGGTLLPRALFAFFRGDGAVDADDGDDTVLLRPPPAYDVVCSRR